MLMPWMCCDNPFPPQMPPRTESRGTPLYVSPEMCLNKPHTTEPDVWGLGICLAFLLTGRHPFNGDTPEELSSAICTQKLDRSCSPWRFAPSSPRLPTLPFGCSSRPIALPLWGRGAQWVGSAMEAFQEDIRDLFSSMRSIVTSSVSESPCLKRTKTLCD